MPVTRLSGAARMLEQSSDVIDEPDAAVAGLR